jgi:cellulose synthase operon protein C
MRCGPAPTSNRDATRSVDSDEGRTVILYRLILWIVLMGWVSLWPLAARTDDLAAAHEALNKGDLRAAQVDLRKAVRADPQNAEAHYWLAWVSIEMSDPVAAEREAEAAQQRGYAKVPTTRLLGQALLQQDKFNEVLRTMQPDGKDAALDASILVLRGYALMGLNQGEEAQAAFDAAQAKAPESVDPLLGMSRLALTRRDLATVRAKIDQALALQPKSPEALLARAQALRMTGDEPGALDVLDHLLDSQPSMPDMIQARLDRATLEIDLNRISAAKADIAEVLKAAPTSVQAIYLQAAVAARAGDFQGADALLQRIVALLPRIPRGYYLLALVKEQLGQLEQALVAARTFLARAPDDLDAYKMVARIALDQRRPDQVVETLVPLVVSGNADAETYQLLGNAYSMGGRAEQAIQAYQKAQSLTPNDISLEATLANMHLGLGQPYAAVADLEHALVVAPKLPQVGQALFFATLATGDLAKAGEALARIRAAEGETVTVQYLDAVLKIIQFDLGGARQTLTMISRYNPEFLPAKISLAHLLAMQGHGDEADKILADILSQRPTQEPALGLLATDYALANRMADAIAVLQRAHAADPADMDVVDKLGNQYIAAGKAQMALDLLAQIKDERVLSVPLRVLKATAEHTLGQNDKARDTLSQLLDSHPLELSVRQLLIGSLLEAGDFDSARNVVKAGLAAVPRTYPLLQAYVVIDLKAHGLEAALATADLLQSQDRGFAPARALRGDVFMAANRLDDAVTAYAEALAAVPDRGLLTRLVVAQTRRGHAEEARTLVLRWVAAHPNDMQALEQLAQLDILAGRLDEAAKALGVILANKSYDSVALNNLAWVYHKQHDDRALGIAREAYLLSPNVTSSDTLGWILTTSGRPDLGLVVLRQAVAQAGGDPTILYHYAIALRDTGGTAEAIKVLTAIAGLAADFPEKADARQSLDALKKAG